MSAQDGVRRDGDTASVLDVEVERVARKVGAQIVAGYLDVPSEQLIRLTVVRGVPEEIALPWSRVPRAAYVPVAEAVRGRQPVWLGDQQELASRFPRTALSFPYPVAMYVAPLLDADECWGAVLLLWPETHPPELSAEERREVDASCRRAAQGLRRAAEAGRPVMPREVPLSLEPPEAKGDPLARLVDRLPGGVCEMDLEGRLTYISSHASELLGRRPDELLHRNLFEAVPWLHDPSFENAYLAALFSRLPTAFRARCPDGPALSFTLYTDDWGITATVEPAGLPAEERISTLTAADAPARAGTLFHLLHMASALAESKTVQEVTDSLSDQTMPVLGAQGFALISEEEGRMVVLSSRGFPDRMREYFDGLPMTSRTEGVRVMETGTPSFHPHSATLVETYPDIEPYGDMAAYVYLPLTISGRTIGCLVLGYERPRPFLPDERAELVSLAGLIAQALERARLYDLNAGAARGLQAGLLPNELPRLAGLSTAARYRPATSGLDVGGDFYDLIRLDHERAAAVVGDVQGHSVRAAALMGQVRTAVHSHAQVGATAAEVLSRTNRLLADLDTDLFASCVYACIDLPRRRALLASAGHPPPLLRRPGGGSEVLDLPPGLLLGVDPDIDFHTTEVDLPPGSLLALYTDGLVERPGIDLGDAIGDLAGAIDDAPEESLGALCDRLISRAQRTAREEKSDDIALLLLQTSDTAAASRPAHPRGGARPGG